MGAPGGAAQQRRGTKAEKGRDQCRSCGLGAAASGPTRTAQFRQSPGTMEREKAGRAGSWTPISGGCGGTRGLSCPGGGRSVRVRAGPDQELRHHRWGGGSLPQVPAGGGGPAQSSLAVSPRREEAEPEGSQHGPCLVPDKSSLAGRRGQPLGVWGPARRGCWQSRPWPGGVPSLQAGDGRAEDRVLLRPLALLVTW